MINFIIFMVIGITIMLLNYKFDSTGHLKYWVSSFVLSTALCTLMMIGEFGYL